MKTSERNGYTLASGNSCGDIFLWSLGINDVILQLNSHNEPIQSLDFSMSDDILLSSTKRGVLDVWNLHTGQNVRQFNTFDGTIKVLFHPYSLLISTVHQNTISLWDPRTKNLINSLVYDDTHLTNLKFSPDGLWACAGDASGKVHIWDLRTTKYLHTLDIKINSHPIIDMCFHPTATSLAIASSQHISYWDVSNMNCKNVVKLSENSLSNIQLVFNRNKLIAFGHNGSNIYDIEEMDNYSYIKLPNTHSFSEIAAISITVDQLRNTICYVGERNKIQVWLLNDNDHIPNIDDEVENQNLINEMFTSSKEFANQMLVRLNSLKDLLSKGEYPLQVISKLKPDIRSKLLIDLIVLKLIEPSGFKALDVKLILTTLQNNICNISEEQGLECISFLKSLLNNFGNQFKESFIFIGNQLKGLSEERSLKFNEELEDYIERVNLLNM